MSLMIRKWCVLTHHTARSRFSIAVAIAIAAQCGTTFAADAAATGTLSAPLPYQVVQREGYDSNAAHSHNPGGRALGEAKVSVQGELTAAPDATYQYRVIALKEAFGHGTEWARIVPTRDKAQFKVDVTIPAGGWYRLEVKADSGGKTVATAAVEPVGVGEVFVVAGQSYAEGANDELMKVEDPQGRVVAFDVVANKWQVANDPQPNRGTGGTIWPSMGNAMLPIAHVPIAFVNVASGGTSSRQWLPGEKLYNNLNDAGKKAGRFRAVLWQQGESDVIESVSTETYVKNLTLIRTQLAGSWGFEPTWLAAKSTLHPTVYNRPVEEGRIRAAIGELWKMRGFRPGPDTDILDGENRGGVGSRRHFSGIGQRRAGLMWFVAAWNEINRADAK